MEIRIIMKTKELLKIMDTIRKKADLNKLVVFVGAGVSRNVPGMPSWNDLVKEMADSIHYTKCNSCKHKSDCKEKCLLFNDYSTDELLKIPQYVFNNNPEIYWKVIEKGISATPTIDSSLSKAIFELNPDHIITTNYDHLLESSSSTFTKLYDVIISDNKLLDTQKGKYIIKMHGDISQKDTIVLREQNYLEYSQTHALIELFIKSLIVDHVILFVGYSLNDMNVKMIISWINYLRMQNNTIPANKYIGYIILDDKIIDKNTQKYFQLNNIQVINIHTFPLISSIPSDINMDKGKRLYSFLKTISDTSLEFQLFPMHHLEKIIDFLYEHKITNYKYLLSKLHINSYELANSILVLHNNTQYDALFNYFHSKSKFINKLHQLFANSGIMEIKKASFNSNSETLYIQEENELYNDPLFTAYIQNDYIELNNLISHEKNINKKLFYQHFLYGYNNIDINDIEANAKGDTIRNDLIKLYNMAIIRIITTHHSSISDVSHYVDNIASSEARQAYAEFKDICSGNISIKFSMINSLNKLKECINKKDTIYLGAGGAISEFYRLKNQAMECFYFYYSNNLFTLDFREVTSFFRVYIEGIICSNDDGLESTRTVSGIETHYNKYSLFPIDVDIISKYILCKELYSLLFNQNVSSLCVTQDGIEHSVYCYVNLINSLILLHTYGSDYSNINTLCNLALLLKKMELSEKHKMTIAQSMQILFSDNDFNNHFWCIFPNNKANVRAIALISKELQPATCNTCITSILSSTHFYELIGNVSIYDIRTILYLFLSDEKNQQSEKLLINFIDNQPDFERKMFLLQLFYKKIHSRKIKEKYMSLLSDNFIKLKPSAVYEFINNSWLTPSSQDISSIIDRFIELKEKQVNGVKVYPDPVTNTLEYIYILHLYGFIIDLSRLEKYADRYPHLMFLLHPDKFDYSSVDFSNYMWVNFANHHKYLQLFIKHREEIIPQLLKRIEKDEATENEKKILYGYLLKKADIMKY